MAVRANAGFQHGSYPTRTLKPTWLNASRCAVRQQLETLHALIQPVMHRGPLAARRDSGGVLLAAKLGGLASFNGLRPFPTVGIEAGYLLGTGDTHLRGMSLFVGYRAAL